MRPTMRAGRPPQLRCGGVLDNGGHNRPRRHLYGKVAERTEVIRNAREKLRAAAGGLGKAGVPFRFRGWDARFAV